MQAGDALLLPLLLPLLLRNAHTVPREGAGDHAPAHHQVGHRPAGAGRVRLLRLRHERDGHAACPPGPQCHHQH